MHRQSRNSRVGVDSHTDVSFHHSHNHSHSRSHTLAAVSVSVSRSSWSCCSSSSSSSSLSLSLSSRFVFVLYCYVLLFVLCFGFVWFPFSSPLVVSVSAQCDINANGVPRGTPSNQALVMWVSSTAHTGALGGRSGANALCNSMQPASLTALGITSQALLSYSDQNAIEAIPANVDIKNTKGQCIAANRQDLFAGLRLAGLLFDEAGQSPGSNTNVFTATTSDGYKAGLGFTFSGSAADFYKTTDTPDKYCGGSEPGSDFTSVGASTVSSIGTLEQGLDGFSKWIEHLVEADAQVDGQTQQNQCSLPRHIYCITSAPTPTQSSTTSNTVAQDPQFVGLQGQRFQVHGIPEEYFNLVSHPFFQLNSHFTYLATGICNYNDTLCWSHPGTYVDELGLMLPGYEIGIFADEHRNGLTVTVNGRTIMGPTTTINHSNLPFNVQFPLRIDNETINSPHTAWLEARHSDSDSTGSTGSNSHDGDGDGACTTSNSCWLLSSSVSVSFLSHLHLVIDTPVATLDIYNADHFFNFGLELRAPRLLLAGAPLDRVPSTHSRHHPSTLAAGTGTGTSGVASAAISPATSPHPTFPMHGLVGQTWKNVKYPHGRLYAGEVDDYMLSDRRLFSTNFVYNEYQY